MVRKTFKFKTQKSFLRVWDALNNSFYVFTSFGNKEITVFGRTAIDDLRQNLKSCRIAFEEI